MSSATQPAVPHSAALDAQPARPRLAFLRGGSSSAFSATLLLMVSSVLSGVLALVRTKYIAAVFGADWRTDAYNAAFNLPDMINYFLVGGVASITLVSILNRLRKEGDEEAADHALSVVLVAMTAVLGVGIVLAEIFAPYYTAIYFHGRLDVRTAELCTHLTRIILPAQLFFFAGGALGSRLLVRKIFVYQAVTPLIYNLGIILGGVFLVRHVGIDSLAYGVVAGALLGSLLMNVLGVMRGGFHFTPVLNLRHPAFVEWVRLSLPLMLGVSLAMADKWILTYYAASDPGGITRMNVAKALFNSPLSVIGMAAGAASLPFFSALFTQDRMFEFSAAVNRSVSRLIAVSLLVSGWLYAMAPAVVGLFRGGRFSAAAAGSTAHYLQLFSVSLALWSAQGIYARAFYAARNTVVPAVSGTVVTLMSIPVYGLLFHHIGIDGLAVASDLGILAHTLALAVLLHRYRLVSLPGLEFHEMARALIAAVMGWVLAQAVADHLPRPAGHLGDLVVLTVGSLLWLAVAAGTLEVSGSALIAQLRRRG